jgi:hypothetical protein
MQIETAKMLTETIARVATIATDNRIKIMAFEKALQEHDPSLFQKYSDILEKSGRTSASLSPEWLLKLQSMLVQD